MAARDLSAGFLTLFSLAAWGGLHDSPVRRALFILIPSAWILIKICIRRRGILDEDQSGKRRRRRWKIGLTAVSAVPAAMVWYAWVKSWVTGLPTITTAPRLLLALAYMVRLKEHSYFHSGFLLLIIAFPLAIWIFGDNLLEGFLGVIMALMARDAFTGAGSPNLWNMLLILFFALASIGRGIERLSSFHRPRWKE